MTNLYNTYFSLMRRKSENNEVVVSLYDEKGVMNNNLKNYFLVFDM